MPKHLHIPHYDQTEDALNYVLMEDWWGARQDGIIQGKQASVGDALNKVRAKIMIYLRTDLHFWSPPIWVYSGLHLLWWYMQPRWWSKWCLVLALQWPFPVGDGGREEDKGKKMTNCLENLMFWPHLPFMQDKQPCTGDGLPRFSLFIFIWHAPYVTPVPMVLEIAIPLSQPSQLPRWEEGH